MLKVWVGLEARSFLQASIDTVWQTTLVLHCDTNKHPGRTMCQVRPAFPEYIIDSCILPHEILCVIQTFSYCERDHNWFL